MLMKLISATVAASLMGVLSGALIPVEAGAESESEPVVIAQVTTVNAPTGAYSAMMGASAATTRTAGGNRIARRAATTEATEGTPIQIRVDSWASRTELEAVASAEDIDAAINGYRMGSLTIGGLVYPINLATSAKVGSNYVMSLLSTRTFSGTGAAGRLAQGGGLGYVTLTVPVSGAVGRGSLYTSVQVGVSESGEVRVLGGATSATQLTEVQGSF